MYDDLQRSASHIQLRLPFCIYLLPKVNGATAAHFFKVNNKFSDFDREIGQPRAAGTKKECHALFDPIWKQNKHIKREQAYGRLANVLGIPHNECHFG
ncbi:hypothetical protein EBB07_03555 [Paenibacillaceae bacterium]|nr:hypothetical protein EBB07_03555 [Paenibacillaceae bacterium]